MDTIDVRDTKIVINLSVLKNNMKLIRDLAGDEIKIMAVVKANGYGHGIVQVAPALLESGADYLAVATLSEALEIKDKYPDFPVFIMGHTPDRLLHITVEKDIAQTIFDLKQAEILDNEASKLKKKATVHIKVDTGFHRLGKVPSEEFRQEVIKIMQLPNLNAEGIFTHLALANDEENEKQFNLFMDFADSVEKEGYNFKYRHLADSIAFVDYPKYRLNMIRPGALIYGMRGFHKGFLPVEQALTFETAVSQLHHIKKGEGVSYDYLWKAEKDSIVATLPFGYADGYPRNLRDKGYVLINGKKAPIVGVICMDQCIADVTDIENVKEGAKAIIYGNSEDGAMDIQEASELAGTNKNDIIARLSARPPRVYVE